MAAGGTFGHLTIPIDLEVAWGEVRNLRESVDRAFQQLWKNYPYQYFPEGEYVRRLKRLEEKVIEAAGMFGIVVGPQRVVTMAEIVEGRLKYYIREKRNALAMFNLILGGVGFGFSLYNFEEIKRLKENSGHIMKELEFEMNALKALNANIETLKTALGNLTEKFAVSDTVREIRWKIEMAENFVSDLLIGLNALHSEKLSPSLIPTKLLYEGVNEIQLKAKMDNLSLIEDNPFNMKFSCLAFETVLEIIVHVPLHDEIFLLYEVVNVPMFVDEKISYEFALDKKFLAIRNNSGILIEQDELNRCSKFDNTYFCDDVVIHREIDITCIGAIFGKKVHVVNQVCEKHFVEKHEYFLYLKNGMMLVYPYSQLYVSCEKDQLHYPSVNFSYLVTIPKKCKGKIGSYEIKIADSIEMKTPPIKPFVLPTVNLTVEELLFVSNSLKRIDKVNFDDVEMLKSESSKENIFVVILGVMSILIALVIIFYCVGYCKYQSRT